jgi:hypothetical protein
MALAAQTEWTPPPSVRRIVSALCREWARAHLRAPTHARFLGTPQVFGEDDFGLVVKGDVEAMNGYGGFDRLPFACFLDLDVENRRYVGNNLVWGGPVPDIVTAGPETAPRTKPLDLGFLPRRTEAARPQRTSGKASWIADQRNEHYYLVSRACWTGQQIPREARLYFATEREAQEAGYRPVAERGCYEE